NAVTNWEIYLSIIDGNGGIIENNSRVTALRRASVTPEISVDSQRTKGRDARSAEGRLRAHEAQSAECRLSRKGSIRKPSTRQEEPKVLTSGRGEASSRHEARSAEYRSRGVTLDKA
ncbi:MAG: hypothetical protein KAU14_06945, partial [Thermoplasmata archaeon]|nr:hypothetical protein [Thermoplasmata archaeon]